MNRRGGWRRWSGLLWALLTATTMGATRTHYFSLGGALTPQLGNPALVAEGGVVTGSGYHFKANQGLNLVQAVDAKHYTIVMEFALDELTSYRKLMDFKHLTTDAGLYNYSGRIYFYPVTSGASNVLELSKPTQLVFTRDGRTSEAACYVNGVRQFAFADTNELAVLAGPTNILRLLVDDFATGQYESGPGSVRQVEVFAGPLTAAEADMLYQATTPLLRIANAGGQITVAWTNLVYGFELERAAGIGPGAVWQAVNGPTRVEGLRQTVGITNTPNPSISIFRLRKHQCR